jgi:cytochrome c oxidase cbb3-type subunit III
MPGRPSRRAARRSSSSPVSFVGILLIAIALFACEREERAYRPMPARAGRDQVPAGVMAFRPADSGIPRQAGNRSERNAYLVSQGNMWFHAFNCSGCHSNFGGGGMGPALSDDEWIYGSTPANVVASILQGRPNGMPSFRGKITEDQAFALAAYVRSLSGQLRKDVSPGRADHISGPTPSSAEYLVPKDNLVSQASEPRQ